MQNSKRHYWRISGFYFFYYAFVGLFAPYWSLYLKSLGLGAVDIAILLSIQPVMRLLAPSMWGWLADGGYEALRTGFGRRNSRARGKPRASGSRRQRVIKVAATLSFLFYLGVFLTKGFWGMLIVLALMGFFWSASMPLVEATTLAWLGSDSARYGRIRSWGSIGFIATVLGLGYAFDFVAIAWLPWVGLLCEAGILIFAAQIPQAEVNVHHTDHLPVRQILSQPHVLALFGACFLMSAAHGAYYTFYSIYLVEHGYAKSSVGALWALGVICEIGVFLIMPWLASQFGYVRILLFSFASAAVRFLLIGWGVDFLGLLLLAQVLHAATFGATHAASMGLVHEFFRGRHQSKGQALFGSLTYGAGGMVGGMLSGLIWQHWGASFLFSCSSGAAFAGLALVSGRLAGKQKARAGP